MPSRVVCSLVFFLALSLFRLASAEVNQKGDFQVWNHQSFRFPLTARWDLRAVAEFRYGDNASFFYTKIYQVQTIYKMFVWLDISPSYRQKWTRFKHSKHQWRAEYLPFVEFCLHGCLAKWGVSNRFRPIYQIKDSGSKSWYFRNRFKLVTPWRFTRLCMAPYVEDEVFIRRDDGIFENRLSAGFQTPIAGNFMSQIYYLLRHEKTVNQWSYQNVCGFRFAFIF